MGDMKYKRHLIYFFDKTDYKFSKNADKIQTIVDLNIRRKKCFCWKHKSFRSESWNCFQSNDT